MEFQGMERERASGSDDEDFIGMGRKDCGLLLWEVEKSSLSILEQPVQRTLWGVVGGQWRKELIVVKNLWS